VRWQLDVAHRTQEGVGDLQEDAGAVSGVGLGARCSAVVEVAERGQRLVDDAAGGLTVERGHEGDSTGVVLVAPVVETLGRGKGAHGPPLVVVGAQQLPD
jgi:hypothetical protein